MELECHQDSTQLHADRKYGGWEASGPVSAVREGSSKTQNGLFFTTKDPANQWHEQGENRETGGTVTAPKASVTRQPIATCDPALDADSKKPTIKRHLCSF